MAAISVDHHFTHTLTLSHSRDKTSLLENTLQKADTLYPRLVLPLVPLKLKCDCIQKRQIIYLKQCSTNISHLNVTFC